MKAPVVILVVCLCLAGVAQALPGVLWPGLGDIAVLGAVAAAVLVLRAWWRRDRTGPLPYVVVDGSNVLHWRDNLPDMGTVRAVVDALKAKGLVPVVWFDANAGYLIEQRFLRADQLAQRLDLPARQVLVAPRGTPADPLLLDMAARLGSQVVSNDRFRDWETQFAAVLAPGRMIRGSMSGGQARLSLPRVAA